ncbi:MAG TPA: hypothetical protein VKE88_04085 [Candidatus Nanoarchaeia archaeon]|nr:hypothetical protein [Candidatus Nanoarchaeia archaeon]
MAESMYDVGGLEKALKAIHIKAILKEKSVSGQFFGKPYVEVKIPFVQPVSDIAIAADVTKIAREVLGYGSVTSDYDPKSKVLLIGYQPLKKEEPKKREVPGCDLRH